MIKPEQIPDALRDEIKRIKSDPSFVEYKKRIREEIERLRTPGKEEA